jgi:replicative DNA helicase
VTSDELYDLLLNNELIADGASPNSSREYVALCPWCERKKCYINADEDSEKFGVYHCQRCGESGSLAKLKAHFTPLTRAQQLDKDFHEYTVRRLISSDEPLQYIFDRDFNEDDIKAFGYGYTDDAYVDHLLDLGYTEDEIQDNGLISDKGNAVFWNHIIIPYRKAGEYETFKGRCLDAKPKIKYISAIGRKIGIYHEENLHRSGRKFWVEGEWKSDAMIVSGRNAAGLSGAENFKKYIQPFNQVDDLWIAFDSDRNGVGQKAAAEAASMLDKCHVITFPLEDGEEKCGADDYLKCHSDEEFEALCDQADHYVKGVKQKPENLSILVKEWKEKAKSHQRAIGFDIGFPRLNEWLGGAQPGALAYLLASAHIGKSILLRNIAYNLYCLNPDLYIDYYSNDDSLDETFPYFVGMIGELNADDCKQPEVAFRGDRVSYRRWEEATEKFAAMSSRFKLLDRSRKRSLESIYEDLVAWREANPDGQRVLIIDGFNKCYSTEAAGNGDRRVQAIIKSDQLKLIAQHASVFVLATDQPAKLFGQRPKSFNVSNSVELEYDASVIASLYQEAHYRGGTQGTELKQIIEYSDGTTSEVPIIECWLQKNKLRHIIDLDLFICHKQTGILEELDDTDHRRFRSMVYASEAKQKKYGD